MTTQSSNSTRTLLIVLIVLVGVLILTPCCIIALLTLLGPAIGNVFSTIKNNLNMIPIQPSLDGLHAWLATIVA